MLDQKQENRVSDYKNTKIPLHDKKIAQNFMSVFIFL